MCKNYRVRRDIEESKEISNLSRTLINTPNDDSIDEGMLPQLSEDVSEEEDDEVLE